MSDSLNDRLVEVESRIVMQERTIEQLNEVILEQATQLERLRAQLQQLSEQMRKSGDDSEHPDPPPPHY